MLTEIIDCGMTEIHGVNFASGSQLIPDQSPFFSRFCEEFEPTSFRSWNSSLFLSRDANALLEHRAKDKGDELKAGAVRGTRILPRPTKRKWNRSERGPRRTKTTCLMVSLVRKKGQTRDRTRRKAELFLIGFFHPLSEFPFTSLPLKPAYISFLVPEPRRLFYHSRVARKAICSTELFDSSLGFKDPRLT